MAREAAIGAPPGPTDAGGQGSDRQIRGLAKQKHVSISPKDSVSHGKSTPGCRSESLRVGPPISL